MKFSGLNSFVLTLLTLVFTVGPILAQSAGTAWRAVDGLARPVVSAGETGPIREGKTVAIFYFLWLSPSSNIPKAPYSQGPYDISKIFQKDPNVMSKPQSPLWAADGQYHFWGEPLYGYYYGNDPWILRRHIHLLADAGIDLLVFDTTNALIYPEVLLPLCDMLQKIKSEGDRVPQITFMLNTGIASTVEKLWKTIYSVGKYDDLFFRLDGKPLLVADPEEIKDPKYLKYWTFRRAHWPFTMINTKDAWHWEATFPQPYGWSKDPNRAEQVNVSVAQNLSRATGKVENMSSGMARGRSFDKNRVNFVPATDKGLNFAEQWTRAYQLNPDIVMITGWNEWIAGRWPRGKEYVFVDQFDREYSRDIEPMKGGHFDNYYLQMIDGIRRFKGTVDMPSAPKWKTIDINDDFSQWNDVKPEFRDHLYETLPRDFDGAGGTHYTNNTGRNDLVVMKYTRDRDNVYFYLRTREKILSELPFGLCLLLETDGDFTNGWIGGDCLIGRTYKSDFVSVERFFGKQTDRTWRWRPCARVPWKCKENELHLSVPVSVLELTDPQCQLDKISFKWLDNFKSRITPAELYLQGDVAPESRFFYSTVSDSTDSIEMTKDQKGAKAD